MVSVLDIAEAVAHQLSSSELCVPFVASTSLRPVYTLEELGTIRVTAVPKAMEMTSLSRETSQFDFTIDVGIQRQVVPEDAEDLRPLVALTTEIFTLLQGRPLLDYPEAVVVKVTNDPIYIPTHLDTLRQYTSVVTITFRLMVESE